MKPPPDLPPVGEEKKKVQGSKFKVQGSLPPTPPEGKGAKFKVSGFKLLQKWRRNAKATNYK